MAYRPPASDFKISHEATKHEELTNREDSSCLRLFVAARRSQDCACPHDSALIPPPRLQARGRSRRYRDRRVSRLDGLNLNVRISNRLLGRLVCGLAFVLGAAVPARAQIYTWRDPNGNLVLSDKPREGAVARTFAVPKADSLRATRFVASDRARAYDSLIDEHARLNSLRPSLVRAVIQVESAFNPRAVSPKGAVGLMQLMPATARQFSVGNAFDPEENVRAGTKYLRQLLDRYDGNEQLALAAYNAGPGAVDKHGQSVPPYRETRSYVSRISEMAGASTPRTGASGKIYRVVEIVDGREVVRYTDKKPGD